MQYAYQLAIQDVAKRTKYDLSRRYWIVFLLERSVHKENLNWWTSWSSNLIWLLKFQIKIILHTRRSKNLCQGYTNVFTVWYQPYCRKRKGVCTNTTVRNYNDVESAESSDSECSLPIPGLDCL